jgi:aminoglycoside phosphotransferase (APT) family kinase protein
MTVADNDTPDIADTSEDIARTTRDDSVLRERLRGWLATQLPAGADPQISEISSPSASGMSSETLLFDATWAGDGGAAEGGAFVGRMAPAEADHPTFPTYDMKMQAGVLRLAGEYGVPVPAVRWLELDASVLGAEFFVMERLDGRVPADMPTYLLEGWVFDATDEERREIQDQTVAAIAKIHSIDITKSDCAFLEFDEPGDTPLRRHVANQRSYYEWMCANGRRSPLIERSFEWLDAHWPNETSTVVAWGDSRIGNIMYDNDGFEPVAVLDWEMAGLGTRELDLGWLSFMHTFFQKLFESMGSPGLPNFLKPDDLAETYESLTGHKVEDLRWYVTYGALRHAIIMSRISERMVLFGQGEPPEDPDNRIPHRATLEGMLDGSYWD